MTSVRIRTLAAGSAVAVLAGVLVNHGAALGADFTKTALLGVAAGAALGLVPHSSAAGRAGGFAVGFLAAWLGYALRAGFLPDIPLGRALAAVVVVSLITAVAVATMDRLPLWSGLVGAGLLIGAYETTYVATPSAFTGESSVAANGVLFAAAFGFVVTTAVMFFAVTDRTTERTTTRRRSNAARDDEYVDGAAILPAPTPRVANDAPAKDTSTR
jgi:hypothetical protein